jgi:hypothetical protein
VKNFKSFALLACFLVLGMAAVLSVTHPELQTAFADWIKSIVVFGKAVIQTIVRAVQFATKGN